MAGDSNVTVEATQLCLWEDDADEGGAPLQFPTEEDFDEIKRELEEELGKAQQKEWQGKQRVLAFDQWDRNCLQEVLAGEMEARHGRSVGVFLRQGAPVADKSRYY